MKRGNGLKRHKSLDRKKPLEGKGDLARTSSLPRTGGPKRKPPLRPPGSREAARAWHDEVTVRGRACCALCGSPPRAVCRIEAHHVVPKRVLKEVARTRGIDPEQLLWDTRNGLPVCQRCHSRHELAVQRLPRHLLSEAHHEFAAEVQAEWFIERTYPEGQL